MILEIMIICVVVQQSCYSDRLQQDLDDAMELAILSLREDYDLKIQDNNKGVGFNPNDSNLVGDMNGLSDFKQKFISSLANNIEMKVQKLEVKIYGADEEHGLLSVEAIVYFKYIGGGTGSVSSYKTVLLNRESL